MRKTALAGVALARTVVGGAASAQNLTDWDSESNGYVSTDEFYSGVADNGYYADWDSNNDGYLDSGEVYDGYFGYYDANEDGHWDNAGEDGFFDM